MHVGNSVGELSGARLVHDLHSWPSPTIYWSNFDDSSHAALSSMLLRPLSPNFRALLVPQHNLYFMPYCTWVCICWHHTGALSVLEKWGTRVCVVCASFCLYSHKIPSSGPISTIQARSGPQHTLEHVSIGFQGLNPITTLQ